MNADYILVIFTLIFVLLSFNALMLTTEILKGNVTCCTAGWIFLYLVLVMFNFCSLNIENNWQCTEWNH